jgi:hypothetical protein
LFKQAWFAFVLCDGIAVFHFVQNVFPKGHLTQSLPNKHCVFVWLFCSSSVYESKLSTQPRNKKAYHFVIGFVATLGISLDEFARDVRAFLELTINSK